MSITTKTIVLNKLERSKKNACKTGGQSIDELAASIAAAGCCSRLSSQVHGRSGCAPASCIAVVVEAEASSKELARPVALAQVVLALRN